MNVKHNLLEHLNKTTLTGRTKSVRKFSDPVTNFLQHPDQKISSNCLLRCKKAWCIR